MFILVSLEVQVVIYISQYMTFSPRALRYEFELHVSNLAQAPLKILACCSSQAIGASV